MQFYFQIQQRKLIALYESDNIEIGKLKPGIVYKADVTAPRNIKLHKKFFALLNLGFQNQDLIKDFEDYREIKIMQAGFYKTIPTGKGIIYRPKSISFGAMDDIQFSQLYDSVLTVLCGELDTNSADIEKELINFM